MSGARLLALAAALSAAAAPAIAQSSRTPAADTRPATTTPSGDSGVWFVPVAETLAPRQWSLSAYRVNVDFQQGFTDVSHFPMTFGFGVGERLELFGAVTAVTRIDRDVRPLFGAANPGGILNELPFVSEGWTGSRFGDIWLGGKVNVASQHRQQPAAFAIRALAKLPTASDEGGAGTGRPDVAFDAILSGEIDERLELAGFAGLMLRSDPEVYDLSNGVRWGVGVAMPTRRNIRLTAELHGEAYIDGDVTFRGVQPALVGLPPIVSPQKNPIHAALGLTWVGRNGLFAGAGISWNLNLDGRSDFGSFADETGDALGFQIRVGYHPGSRVYTPPPSPDPHPPAPAEAANRPPTVTAGCAPCTVEVGGTSTITSDATDPDGDVLAYRWAAPAGTLSSPAARETVWTAPMQEGPVPVTIVVEDGRGGTATDAITIHVLRPVVRELTFEDVHFDFDRYSLRPEATRALDEVVSALRGNADARIEIEGHTCNIGTAEYNLALGERRAAAVRDYLTGRGVGPERLRTISYGEERPKHDNAREETRRLNRRAALVVRVQR